MTDVFFEILSPLPLNRHQDARRLFQLWADNAFHFLPNRWGLYEPLRHHFSLPTLDEAIRTWEYAYHVKRTASPKLSGSIFMQYGPHRDHATWTICLNNIKDFEQPSFCQLLECAASIFSADLASFTRLQTRRYREAEQTAQCFLDAAHTEPDLFIVTHRLNKFLPDIYWTTCSASPSCSCFPATSPVVSCLPCEGIGQWLHRRPAHARVEGHNGGGSSI